jgi:hypothetical protein
MSIIEVLKQRPDLTIDGLSRQHRLDFEQRQAKLLAATNEFECAVAWFLLVPKIKTINRGGRYYSYTIKNDIKRWSGVYVPNGVAIAAALHLGFSIEQDDNNCWIAASLKRPTLPPPPY